MSAQLSTATYLRSLFLLLMAGIVGSIAVGVGTYLEQQKLLKCIGQQYLCGDSGGSTVLIVGGIISLILLVWGIAEASTANVHRRNAGG